AALKSGDTVATVSLSWGGAGLFPERYAQGKKQFQDAFGVKIVETPNSLKTDELSDNPQLRLDDLMAAFKNPEIKAILTNIGGSDTVRLLSLMNEKHFEIIHNNPKIFLGMSDTTANHFMCLKAGLSSFYSPSTLFGYAENGGTPEYIVNSVKKTLFDTNPIGILPESKDFIMDKVRWDDKNDIYRERTPASGWKYIQGNKKTQGRLVGGCMEVLGMINGTSLWPIVDEWKDTILFVETSEDMLPLDIFVYFLRNLGAQGILNNLNGILLGRPGGSFKKDQVAEKEAWLEKYAKYDKYLLQICKEYGCTDIPIVTHMDFGHTVPQMLLPYGVLTEIDPINKTVSILESGVI
ncbi:MAG: LD-carboxypeptidase, partial [Rickettsiales bacterium]|nr:LD-carboxypeptidase [Rickettsiales bacterium]